MVENAYEKVREDSKKHETVQSVMRYVNKANLAEEHRRQSGRKAMGVDGIAKEAYGANLEANLDDLLARMKRFSYRPQPVRRTYIPKSNGKMRPLGIPSYEDKLVQGVMAKVLGNVYEPRFLDCSYGFREGRGCHDVVKAINDRIMFGKVNYVVEADIKGFFDNVKHKTLTEFLERDIADPNFIRYVVRFLKAGVMEDLKVHESDKGTPQGGLISPVLANVYLHYVLDLWFETVVKPRMKGDAYLYRYADDFIVLFDKESDARRFYEVLPKRLARYGLEVAEDKTRILPFGRFKGTKEGFDFLGFTFLNGRTLNGKYRVAIISSKKKMKAKRQAVKEWLHEHMHDPLDWTFKTLKAKMVGHYRYYGINGNLQQMGKFQRYIQWSLFRALNRRSQKRSLTWEKFYLIWNRYEMPSPRIYVQIWG